MKKMKYAAVLLTLILLTGTAAGCGTASKKTGISESRTAETAAETDSDLNNLNSFKATTLDSKTFTQKDFAGKDITVINCWSTGCGSCIDEMPDLAKLAKSLPANVQFITYCLDGSDYAKYAEDILKQAGYEGTTLISGDGDLEKLNEKIQYTPTTVFVDKNGNIVGEAIIGSDANITETFKNSINSALKSIGKEAVL